MSIQGLYLFLIGAAALLLTAACATTPTGRQQLQLFSPREMAGMGDAAYEKLREQTPIEDNPAAIQYVGCVVSALSAVVPPPEGGGAWEATLFREDTPNAFALPGGHIGVYTGMLKVARTPSQLAAVIAHEIGHLEADHPNARLSTEFATETGLQLLGALMGSEVGGGRQIMSLLGVGAQVGIILPFSRDQEAEADLLGLRYMAAAGFDPREAVELWRNMMRRDAGRSPAFLSTHPSDQERISNLESHMNQAMQLSMQARGAGRRPMCRPAGT